MTALRTQLDDNIQGKHSDYLRVTPLVTGYVSQTKCHIHFLVQTEKRNWDFEPREIAAVAALDTLFMDSLNKKIWSTLNAKINVPSMCDFVREFIPLSMIFRIQ